MMYTKGVVSMRKFSILAMSLAVCLCLALYVPQVFADDNAATATKLVSMVKGPHNHPEYYTGKHGYMNDSDIASEGTLEKGLYLMSWMVLDPPIRLGAGGGIASMGKDLYKDYFDVPELEVSAKKNNWPVPGQMSIKQNNLKEDMYWIPINFMDMVDAKQGALFASGNEFDWAEWGGRDEAKNQQFHEYLFTLAKWNNGGEITLKQGRDDPAVTWVNGEKICEGLADANWVRDTDVGKFTAKAGEWTAIFAELGENTGECGYTLRVEPPPDDGTLNTVTLMEVASQGKMPIMWGYIKTSY